MRPRSPMHQAALSYARRGVPTFPCVPGGKRPITAHGYESASSDPAQIDRWFSREPDANLALPTGLRSGFLVLDLDVKHGVDGRATVAAFESTLGALPATLTSTTPSGGQHRWFRATGRVIRCSVGRLAGQDAPGLDVRGDGGYVVVPPSVIAGRPYSWCARCAVVDLPAPWLNALAGPERVRVETAEWPPIDGERDHLARWCWAAVREEARRLAGTALGQRNDRLWRAAAALGGLVHLRAIDTADARRALAWACATWRPREPPKDADTLERGLAWGAAHPRTVPFAFRRAC